MDEQIHGVTLAKLAELTRFKDVLDPAGFAKHLGEEGLTAEVYQQAWDGWMDRFGKDAKLEARFAALRHGRSEAEIEFDEEAPTKKTESPFVTEKE